MLLDPRSRDAARIALLGVEILIVLVWVDLPDTASAELQSAAGGKSGHRGAFGRFVQFINRLADYTIPIGSAFFVLGLIWGGLLFRAGDTRAGRVLGFVALGGSRRDAIPEGDPVAGGPSRTGTLRIPVRRAPGRTTFGNAGRVGRVSAAWT